MQGSRGTLTASLVFIHDPRRITKPRLFQNSSHAAYCGAAACRAGATAGAAGSVSVPAVPAAADAFPTVSSLAACHAAAAAAVVSAVPPESVNFFCDRATNFEKNVFMAVFSLGVQPAV